MSAQSAEAFRKAVAMMKILRNSTVVVGLSGSSDSVALTYLAKRTFKKVLALTVNLNMHEENTREAERVKEIARSLEVEHRVVTLDWEEGGRRMTESVARHRRYPALMEQCRKEGAGVLMVAHSQDDQIETVVYRMSKSSGVDGMGGMPPLSYWANYPDIGIARPLLDCPRSSLEVLCREAGLSWAESDSSSGGEGGGGGGSERELFKSIPRKHAELRDGLLEMISLCREARDIVHPQVTHTVKRLPAVDAQHGTLSFPLSTYCSLNPAVARRVLSLWTRYIGGVSDVRYDLIIPMHRLLTDAKHPMNITRSNIIMAVDPDQKRSTVARRSPDSKYRVKVPIRVGETILWDNRFQISLTPRNAAATGRGSRNSFSAPKNASAATAEGSPVFYVRHLIPKDWPYMSKGGVRRKHPVFVRGGLPVVVDERDKIVLMPHFRVASRGVDVAAFVKFKPVRSMEDLLQYSHYHTC